MNKSNTLYWKTATDPAERIEVRLVLNSYIDNDNLYVGLESRSKNNPECWESYTDITVNLNSLPPFHAYVDNRDCNRHMHDFLTSNRIAEPAGFEYQGFRMFRFNPDRLKELAPEQFKTISAKLPPQDDMIKDIIYQERHFPLRTVQDIHGIYLVSSKELEESLIEGVRNLDAAANELLDIVGIKASFILTQMGDTIYFSARSIDEINVQIIMERLGGGRNALFSGNREKIL